MSQFASRVIRFLIKRTENKILKMVLTNTAGFKLCLMKPTKIH